MKKRVLIVTDVQNDFCPGGKLGIKNGDKIIPVINKILDKFDRIVATQDWHPVNHVSFASTHNKRPGDVITINNLRQELWPDHCIQGSAGADFHKDLNLAPVGLILKKGTNPEIDSYSVFFENDRVTKTGLDFYIRGMELEEVYLCGLATDYCVYYSAMDAKTLGFDTYVILDASMGIDIPENNIEKTLIDLRNRGVKIVNHSDI